ncbi:MAG: ABC transporter ATP-binding protein [Alphaproteobacteria bacterium]
MEIRFQGISKTYEAARVQVPVFRRLSFEARDSEFLSLVGPSGCGKSTLLSMAAGLIRPDEGRIEFVGHRSASGPFTTIVWQDYALVPWRTVLSNVTYGLEVRRVPKSQRDALGLEALARMGIRDFAGAHPHQLSGGMRQRVGIARALANDPEVFLMDEPFGAVDAQTRTILQEELLEVWAATKRTVIFITHNIEEAIFLGDRVLVFGIRPKGLIREVLIPFKRPRARAIETDPEFMKIRTTIWEDLRAVQVDKQRREAASDC